jgi:putative RNA 2'-phosphotransferase
MEAQEPALEQSAPQGVDYERLSRTVSHALRHAPEQYNIELDEEGWTSTESLLENLKLIRPEWKI